MCGFLGSRGGRGVGVWRGRGFVRVFRVSGGVGGVVVGREVGGCRLGFLGFSYSFSKEGDKDGRREGGRKE